MDSASPNITLLASSSRELEVSTRLLAQASPSSEQASQVTTKSPSTNSAALVSAETVSVKETGTSDAPESSSESGSEQSEKEIRESIRAAEEKSRLLEQTFARINAPFRVRFEGSGNGINFQVVEAESGKVIRSFPPNAAQSILDRFAIDVTGGLLDESA